VHDERQRLDSFRRRETIVDFHPLITKNSMNSVVISDTLEMLNYQNQKPLRRNSRNMEAIKSQGSVLPSEYSNNANSKTKFELNRWDTEVRRDLMGEDNDLLTDHQKQFDPDFVL
jgi:hypothetical protein